MPGQVWHQLFAANSHWPEPNVWHKPPGPVLRRHHGVSPADIVQSKEWSRRKQHKHERQLHKLELLLAITQRQLEKVKEILTGNCSLLEGHAEDGATPLIVASAVGDEAICGYLLELGALTTASDSVGATPLIRASYRGHIGVVRQLLSSRQGANTGRQAMLAQRSTAGESALMAAAKAGHTDIVQVLLDAGAGAGECDNNGMSALMMASRKGRLEVVKLLLQRGADAMTTDAQGCTALMHAARGGSEQLLQLLLTLHPAEELPTILRKQDLQGHSALAHACLGGSAAAVKLLLRSLAAASVPLHEGSGRRGILALACEGGNPQLVKYLLDGRVVDEVELVQDGEDSPVHAAARYSRSDAIALLLEKGARIDARDKHGRTPLAAAAVAGMNDTVRMLVARGADLRAVDKAGHVPRQLAYLHQHLDTAQLLSDLGRSHLLDPDGDHYSEILAEEKAAAARELATA